jgi:hypothetical protein
MEFPAAANATLPGETVAAADTFTVAVSKVLELGAIVAGFAATVSVDGEACGVTVTTAVPLEPEKPGLPEYAAVIESFPIPRLAPFTVTDAMAVALEMERFVVPSVVLPDMKVTVPVGGAVPEAFTVADRTVEAVWRIEAGAAASVTVVAAGETVRVTVRGADDELPKPLPPG